MWHVEEKGLVSMPLDEVDAMSGYQVGGVTLFGKSVVVFPPVFSATPVDVIKEVSIARSEPAKFIERLIERKKRWLVSEMPFPEATCGIAFFLEKFCDGNGFERQAGVVVSNARNSAIELGTETLLVHPGKGGDASGCAHGAGRVEISKAESGCRQGVDVWGVVDGTPVAAKVAVAEVIGHDEDDVGSG